MKETFHSLDSMQIALLRMATQGLVLPARDDDDGEARNDLALLVQLKLVEFANGDFVATSAGREYLRRIDLPDEGTSPP